MAKTAGIKSQQQTNHIALLRAMVKLLQGSSTSSSSIDALLTSIDGTLDSLSLLIEDSNYIVGSGVNVSDMDGPGAASFDDSVKLRLTEEDTTAGVTYVGYSKPDTATSNGEWILEKITTVEVGSVTTVTYEYTKDTWDNRASATFH